MNTEYFNDLTPGFFSKEDITQSTDKEVSDCLAVNYTNEYIKEYIRSKDKITDTDTSNWSFILGNLLISKMFVCFGNINFIFKDKMFRMRK